MDGATKNGMWGNRKCVCKGIPGEHTLHRISLPLCPHATLDFLLLLSMISAKPKPIVISNAIQNVNDKSKHPPRMQ